MINIRFFRKLLVLSMLFLTFSSISFCREKLIGQIKNETANYKYQDTHKADLLFTYSKELIKNGSDNEAKTIAQKSLELSKKIRYEKGIANAHLLLAHLYRYKTVDKAISSTLKSIRIYKELNNKLSLMDAYVTLSELYMILDRFNEALAINLLQVDLLKTMKHSKMNARVYYYTSICYKQLNDLPRAVAYCQKALESAKFNANLAGIAIAESELGQLFSLQKRYIEATEFLERTFERAKKSGKHSSIANTGQNLGNLYFQQKKFDSAIYYLKLSVSAYDSLERIDFSKQEALRKLAEAYEKNEYFSEATLVCKQIIQLLDSQLINDNDKLGKELLAKYETKKLELEKKAAIEKAVINKRFNWVLIVFLVLILLLTIFLWKKIKQTRYQKVELEKSMLLLQEKTTHELATSHLTALKSQMNPHFIFNSLNSIQDLILKKDTETSYDYIVLFSELVRNTLNYSGSELITIEKEVNFLQVYLELEMLRFGDELNYKIDVKNAHYDLVIPPFIIQPFIENALSHGLIHKEGLKELVVHFEVKNKELICTITDNGVGRAASSKINKRRGKEHNSFGLSATQERLGLYNRKHNINCRLQIIDLQEKGLSKGTSVVLTIPQNIEVLK